MQQIFDIENCVQPWVVGKEVKVRFLTTRKMGCLNFIGCKIRKSNRNRTNFTAKKLVSSLFRIFYVASCPILHFKALTLYFLSVPNLPSPNRTWEYIQPDFFSKAGIPHNEKLHNLYGKT